MTARTGLEIRTARCIINRCRTVTMKHSVLVEVQVLRGTIRLSSLVVIRDRYLEMILKWGRGEMMILIAQVLLRSMVALGRGKEHQQKR